MLVGVAKKKRTHVGSAKNVERQVIETWASRNLIVMMQSGRSTTELHPHGLLFIEKMSLITNIN